MAGTVALHGGSGAPSVKRSRWRGRQQTFSIFLRRALALIDGSTQQQRRAPACFSRQRKTARGRLAHDASIARKRAGGMALSPTGGWHVVAPSLQAARSVRGAPMTCALQRRAPINGQRPLSACLFLDWRIARPWRVLPPQRTQQRTDAPASNGVALAVT